MLGWDWNARQNSGLGTACYEIAKKLGNSVELTVIIPKKEKKATIENIHIIGLNELPYQEHEYVQVVKTYLPEPVADVITVPVELNPYPIYEERIVWRQAEPKTEILTVVKYKKYIPEKMFRQTDEIYGENTIAKINAYSELVVNLAKQIKFDIIYAHDWATFNGALQIQEMTRKPLVLHVHSLETDRSGRNSRNQAFEIEKNAFSRADLILTVSEYTRQAMVNLYEADTGIIKVVHNGMNHLKGYASLSRKIKKVSPKSITPKNYYRITFAGRVVHSKGVIQFVETANLLLQQIPNLRFAVAGEGEALWDMMFRSKELGIIGRFDFLGFLPADKLAELFAETDVYFMPSVSEPFGLTALEATEMGVPVVLSKQSGVAEVLQNALCADFWDTQKFAEHIVTLLTQSDIRNQYWQKIQQDIIQATWENTGKNILEHLQEIAEDYEVPWFI